MDVVRTPPERFEGLPGYAFAEHWTEVDPHDDSSTKLRVHYVDEGPSDADPILMLHGEPTWSYLYRKMIPIFAKAGHRAIAPDLVGFGKSDKPTKTSDYTYARHVAWMHELVETLDLRNITLVCQDWGSLIGLRLAAEQSDRFARLVIANGFLPTANHAMPLAFRAWRAFSKYSPLFPISRIVSAGCVDKLADDVRAAYQAPFPSRAHMAGARIFPSLVPMTEDDPAVPDNRAAWEVLGRFDKPTLTIFGRADPILGRADRPLQQHIPGAKDQPHERIRAGHFIQEDAGEYLAEAIVRWLDG